MAKSFCVDPPPSVPPFPSKKPVTPPENLPMPFLNPLYTRSLAKALTKVDLLPRKRLTPFVSILRQNSVRIQKNSKAWEKKSRFLEKGVAAARARLRGEDVVGDWRRRFSGVSWKPLARMEPTSYRNEANSLKSGESLSVKWENEVGDESREERDSHLGCDQILWCHVAFFRWRKGVGEVRFLKD